MRIRPRPSTPFARGVLLLALVLPFGACERGAGNGSDSLAGDWDYYRMLGAEPSGEH